MCGWSAKGVSCGQRAIECSAACTIVASCWGDPRPVERRQQQLALAHVRLAVDHEQRVAAEHAAEQAVDVAHVHLLGRAAEDLADVGRIAHEDDVGAGADPHRERLAELGRAAIHEAGGIADPRDRLAKAGTVGAGRQRRGRRLVGDAQRGGHAEAARGGVAGGDLGQDGRGAVDVKWRERLPGPVVR